MHYSICKNNATHPLKSSVQLVKGGSVACLHCITLASCSMHPIPLTGFGSTGREVGAQGGRPSSAREHVAASIEPFILSPGVSVCVSICASNEHPVLPLELYPDRALGAPKANLNWACLCSENDIRAASRWSNSSFSLKGGLCYVLCIL